MRARVTAGSVSIMGYYEGSGRQAARHKIGNCCSEEERSNR